MEQFTRAQLEMVAMIGSWSTLILLFLGLRAAWRKATEAIRTAYIGLQLLSDQKAHEAEVNRRLGEYRKLGKRSD